MQDSPLAGFRAAFAPEVRDVPMLEVRGLPAGAGIRIATLDTYDGIVYSVGGGDGTAESGRFTRVPYRLDQSDVIGEETRLDVEVVGYADVWVPGVGQLERISFGGPRAELLADGFFYNDVTGTAAVQVGLQSGDSYTAHSVAPVEPESLAVLRPGTSVLPAAPELPDGLARLLDEWAPASDDRGVRLQKMLAGFQSAGYVSHGLEEEPLSRSGHAIDRLEELATERPMIGDGEQYAVAAALMAREIGFPARVVVGYLPDPDDPLPDAGEPTTFDSGDLQAWIEVQTADGAWLSIDPNPELRPIPEREPDEPTVVSRPQSALPPPPERTPVDDLDSDPDVALDQRDDGAEPWVAALLGALDHRRASWCSGSPCSSAPSSRSSSRSSGVDGCVVAPRRPSSASRAAGRSSPTPRRTSATRSARTRPAPSRRRRSAASPRWCSPPWSIVPSTLPTGRPTATTSASGTPSTNCRSGSAHRVHAASASSPRSR